MNLRQQKTMLPFCHIGVYLAFMKRDHALIGLLLSTLAIQAASPARSLGAYGDWGAFAGGAAGACFAVARPQPDGRDRGTAALSALVPRAGAAPQLHVRLAGPRPPAAAATAEVGGRRVALSGEGVDLWPADPREGPALLAAMRGGDGLRIRTTDAAGRARTDRYRLAGFASALDAAILGCAPRSR